MKNFTKLFARLIPAFLFVFLFASPTKAFFVQSGDTVLIPADKKIDEAALITGSSVTIDANINGDLFCAGRDIIINGNVKGDISCAVQSLKVNGTVDGNIRAVGQTIDIAGITTRNLMVVAQKLVLEPKSQIKGDVFFGVQSVELSGTMGRDLAGAGEMITVTGSLLRNALVSASSLSVIETGKIGGNLDYYMEKTATASVGVKNIKGVITRHEITPPSQPEIEQKVNKVSAIAIVMKSIFGILSFSLLGLALVYFDRKNTEKRIAAITEKPFIMGLIGFAVLIVAPFAFILLLITVIGMPFAFVAMFVYLVALIIASLYPSAVYGKLFFNKLLNKDNISLPWQMVTGVILLGLVSCIPFVGGFITFVSFSMGLGAFLVSFSPEKK